MSTTHQTRAVIVNPASASGRTSKRWRSIVDELRAACPDETIEPHLTTCAGDAIRIVREQIDDGVRRFIVLGGDGTVGEVIGGCVEPDGSAAADVDIELAIVHQGTGGDHARGLGIPHETAAAIAIAATGHPRPFDVGVARFVAPDGSASVRAFGSTANIGMSSEVVQRATGRMKRLGKSASFAVATVQCLLRNRPRPVTMRLDASDEFEQQIVDVIVANNTHMGGGMRVAPDALHDDGLFDVVRIAGAGRIRLLRTFPKIYSGRHIHEPIVDVARCASFSIASVVGAPEQGVVLDGELVGHTPATFTVLPGAVRVLVPAG